jgi:hypothetical protein
MRRDLMCVACAGIGGVPLSVSWTLPSRRLIRISSLLYLAFSFQLGIGTKCSEPMPRNAFRFATRGHALNSAVRPHAQRKNTVVSVFRFGHAVFRNSRHAFVDLGKHATVVPYDVPSPLLCSLISWIRSPRPGGLCRAGSLLPRGFRLRRGRRARVRAQLAGDCPTENCARIFECIFCLLIFAVLFWSEYLEQFCPFC